MRRPRPSRMVIIWMPSPMKPIAQSIFLPLGRLPPAQNINPATSKSVTEFWGARWNIWIGVQTGHFQTGYFQAKAPVSDHRVVPDVPFLRDIARGGDHRPPPWCFTAYFSSRRYLRISCCNGWVCWWIGGLSGSVPACAGSGAGSWWPAQHRCSLSSRCFGSFFCGPDSFPKFSFPRARSA